MNILLKLKDIRNFTPDVSFMEEQEEGTEFSYEADPKEEILNFNGKFIQPKYANPEENDERFSAFLDGSYRIAKMGYISFVPIYIASISGAVLRREGRRLYDTGILKNFIAIICPFESLKKYHDKYGDKRISEDIEEFLNFTNDDKNTIQDYELEGKKEDTCSILDKFDNATVSVIADISYRGVRGGSERPLQIHPENIHDIGAIYRKARARARVLMSILEILYLKKYRDKYGMDDWVLVDGTLNYAHKFFLATTKQHEALKRYFKKTVGFIKTIRRRVFDKNPDKLAELFSMKENQYIVSLADKTDTEKEVEEEIGESEVEGEMKWGFIYLRFRMPKYLSITNKGLVKLQFIPEGEQKETLEKARKIANMISFEKFPVPSDRRRIWNEAVAIEETEKVAKSRLHSMLFLQTAGL